MAANDIPDPAETMRRAQENLNLTMERLDEHIQALTKPTAQLALAAEKRAAEGAEEVEPSSLLKKFVSWAKAPVGMWGAGGLNETPGATSDAGKAAEESAQQKQKVAWEKYFGTHEGERGMPPTAGGEAPGVLQGKTQQEAAELAGKEISIPQFGDWQVDSLLKLASQVAAKKAAKSYKSQAEGEFQAGETPISPGEWADQQTGPLASSNLAGVFQKGAQIAAVGSLFHKKVIGPVADAIFQATNMGASLGYTPQAGGGGIFGQEGLGASHILGIPNPIAQFLSPAGKAGMGTVANAVSASFGGTGIGYGEALGLREALGAQGWRNTRGGGLLNFTEGGAQETLARALEPIMKQGVKNPELLAEFSDAVRLGTASVQELTESLGGSTGLSETAQTLNKTVEATAAALQEFAAKSVEGGSTMIHGFQAGREVAAMTGMNPNIVSAINNSNFGRVQALESHVLPWQIEGMSAAGKTLNALGTVEKVMKYVPKNLKPIERTNVNGEKEVIETVAEQEYGWMHQLDPNITQEQARHLKELSGKLPYITAGLHAARNIDVNAYNKEQANMAHGAWIGEAQKARGTWEKQHEATMALKKKVNEASGIAKEEAEEELREAEEREHGTAGKLHSLASKGKKEGALNPAQEAELNRQLGGPKGLFVTAKDAGVEAKELQRIHGITSPADQAKELHKALEKIAQVNIEKKQQEEAAKIELGPSAKYLFRLQFPKVSKFLEQNAGGEQTSNSAANPNPATEAASAQAVQRGVERAHRQE